jgi:hypothetical protein
MIAIGARSVAVLDAREGIRPLFRIESPSVCERFIGASDFDLDGNMDLLFTDGYTLTLIRDPAGRMETSVCTTPQEFFLESVHIVDLDLDGDPDILVNSGSYFFPFLNPSARQQGAQDHVGRPQIRLLGGQPSRGALRCSIVPRSVGPMTIALHDVTGRTAHAETREIVTLNPIPFVLSPDATTDGIAAGVYFLRVSSAAGSSSARIVWIP